jgi:hypothetical protein
MANLPFGIDPKELVPLAQGLALGVAIMVFLCLLGLLAGLTPALQFGVPHQ